MIENDGSIVENLFVKKEITISLSSFERELDKRDGYVYPPAAQVGFI